MDASSVVNPSDADSRYSRQTRFAPIGEAGQARIRKATAVIAGCGALGTIEAELLARAGVGRLRIIDRDYIEWSNLQRQLLFSEQDARDALPKAVAAAQHLSGINSDVLLEPMVADLTAASIDDLFESADVIIDGTDNFETRFLINDYSVRQGIPWIYSAAVGSYGLKMAVIPGQTACLRCVYPEPPGGTQPTCETDGVMGPLTAVIGSLAAADALKLLAVGPEAMSGKITRIDVWTGEIRQSAPPPRDPECPCCARREFVYLNGAQRAPISLCGRNAVQIHERARDVDLNELARRLAPIASVRSNEFALRATIEAYEITVFPDGRAIIKGTTDPGIARSLYARFIGN